MCIRDRVKTRKSRKADLLAQQAQEAVNSASAASADAQVAADAAKEAIIKAKSSSAQSAEDNEPAHVTEQNSTQSTASATLTRKRTKLTLAKIHANEAEHHTIASVDKGDEAVTTSKFPNAALLRAAAIAFGDDPVMGAHDDELKAANINPDDLAEERAAALANVKSQVDKNKTKKARTSTSSESKKTKTTKRTKSTAKDAASQSDADSATDASSAAQSSLAMSSADAIETTSTDTQVAVKKTTTHSRSKGSSAKSTADTTQEDTQVVKSPKSRSCKATAAADEALSETQATKRTTRRRSSKTAAAQGEASAIAYEAAEVVKPKRTRAKKSAEQPLVMAIQPSFVSTTEHDDSCMKYAQYTMLIASWSSTRDANGITLSVARY